MEITVEPQSKCFKKPESNLLLVTTNNKQTSLEKQRYVFFVKVTKGFSFSSVIANPTYIFFHFCTLYNVILYDTHSWVTCLFLPINSASQGLAVNNTLDFMTNIKINRQTVPEKLTAVQFFL